MVVMTMYPPIKAQLASAVSVLSLLELPESFKQQLSQLNLSSVPAGVLDASMKDWRPVTVFTGAVFHNAKFGTFGSS